MDIAKRKEQFSIAYIQAIAAQIGLNHSIDAVDEDSVDITLKGKGFVGGKLRNPIIEIQLKCTSQDIIKGNSIKYPLKLKNYNDLRGEDVTVPRYIMLLIVPTKIKNWTHFTNNALILFNSCYWTSIRYKPEVNNTTNVTIEFSIHKKVTSESLMELMVMASKEQYI